MAGCGGRASITSDLNVTVVVGDKNQWNAGVTACSPLLDYMTDRATMRLLVGTGGGHGQSIFGKMIEGLKGTTCRE